MPRFINPIPQYILSDGDLAAAGTLTFYELNSDIPLTIYGDNEETTTIANPVFLGDRGEVPNVFFSVSARVVFADASGNQIFDIQPVEAGGGSGGGVSGWSTNITYGQLSIVFGSDSQFYISLKNDNTGNDPAATADDSANWSRLKLFRFWNDQETYQLNDIVLRGAVLYVSRIGDNLANDPALDAGGNWLTLYDAALVPFDGAAAGLVSNNVKSALDELKALVGAVSQPYAYRGVLDVSSGDPSLPASPVNGDFYIIGVGGTITVSENGAAPASKAVVTGNAIAYNLEETRWDLVPTSTTAAAVSYNNLMSQITSTDVQSAIDEVNSQVETNVTAINGLNSTLIGLGGALFYRGQLDVSAGDVALPVAPDAGDLYRISTGGTITVSVNGAAPTATSVTVGDQIAFNFDATQWDLFAGGTDADQIIYSNTVSGLSATNVQSAIDEVYSDVQALEAENFKFLVINSTQSITKTARFTDITKTSNSSIVLTFEDESFSTGDIVRVRKTQQTGDITVVTTGNQVAPDGSTSTTNTMADGTALTVEFVYTGATWNWRVF